MNTVGNLTQMSSVFSNVKINEGDYAKKLNDMKAQAGNTSNKGQDESLGALLSVLNGMLKSCEMMNGQHYTGQSWSVLMKAYGKAKGIADSDNPTPAQVRKAISELGGKLSSLQRSEKDTEDDNGLRDPLPVPIQGILNAQAAASAQAVPITAQSLDVSL